ncbi:MAG: hypothetical protein MH252_05625 [Thermosynechococcaceae cyanobacterium MS004]|nr:hypothetical protein [Thermosynechococcaceae cyanobacterium MS004]
MVEINAASTYFYLLALVEHRNDDTWGCHILEAVDQGLDPKRTIADFGSGQRAGHQEVFGDEVPCHGDVFYLQHQCQGVVNSLERQAMGVTTQRQSLEKEMEKAKQKGQGKRLSTQLTQSRQAESITIGFARDVKTLIQWPSRNVLELAGSSQASITIRGLLVEPSRLDGYS